MNKINVLIKLKLVLLAGCALGLTQSTFANGILWPTQNASGLGVAYAGSGALAENASILQYNAAGISLLEGTQVSLGGVLKHASVHFQDEGSSTGVLSGDGGGAAHTHVLPNAYLSTALSSQWFLGVGITQPYDYKLNYDSRWTGAAQATQFEVTGYNINPTLAWRVTPKIALGVGLNYQYLDAKYVRLGGVDPILSKQSVKVDGSGGDWGWNIGVLLTPSDRTRVGVSYRGNVKHKLSDNIDADFKIPDTFSVSVAQKLNDRWEILGDLTWTGWGSTDKLPLIGSSQALSVDYRDTWKFALGGLYTLDPNWTLKFGAAYEQTPVRNDSQRTVWMPDANRIWLTTGARYAVNKTSALDIGFAYLYSNQVHIQSDQRPLLGGFVRGEYDVHSWLMGVQYSLGF